MLAMTKLREALSDACNEVEAMIKNCDKDEYLLYAQLRAMQWNLKRMQNLVELRDRIASRLRKRTR